MQAISGEVDAYLDVKRDSPPSSSVYLCSAEHPARTTCEAMCETEDVSAPTASNSSSYASASSDNEERICVSIYCLGMEAGACRRRCTVVIHVLREFETSIGLFLPACVDCSSTRDI